MSSTKESSTKKPLSLSRPGRLELKKTVESGQVRQSFSHGRSKTVQVEVKRSRTWERGASGRMKEVMPSEQAEAEAPAVEEEAQAAAPVSSRLSEHERQSRMRALQGAVEEEARRAIEEEERREREAEEAARQAELEALRAAQVESDAAARETAAEAAPEIASEAEAPAASVAPQDLPLAALETPPDALPAGAKSSRPAMEADDLGGVFSERIDE